MSEYHETIVGVFAYPEAARRAIDDLIEAGVSKHKIGVLARDTAGRTKVETVEDGEGTRAGEGAAIGAATGAGGGALWALGVAAGVLPAIGPVIAGGLLAAVLASAASGAVAGGVVGALVGLGLPDEDAEYYKDQFISGRTVVVVEADERGIECLEIMRRHGGYDRSTAPGVPPTEPPSTAPIL